MLCSPFVLWSSDVELDGFRKFTWSVGLGRGMNPMKAHEVLPKEMNGERDYLVYE